MKKAVVHGGPTLAAVRRHCHRFAGTPLNPKRLFAMMFGLPAKDFCAQIVAVVHPEGAVQTRVVRRTGVQTLISAKEIRPHGTLYGS